jgi:orotidine-5'-phosphate decarboxylase
MMTTEVPAAVRDRLVLGLDVPSLAEAEAIARRVAPWFAVVKVGYQLYGEAGPAAFDRMHELGLRVFCDLKLHDIPNTVEQGARQLARRRVEFLNAHAAGGETMLRAFVAGARAGASDVGGEPPVTLAVTVLTSEPDASAFPGRLATAAVAGCDGVVCSVHEVRQATAAGLRTMVPGIRLPGGDRHDQARVATPGEAVATGASWIILARAILDAPDPEAAAANAATEVATALGSG